MGCQSFQSILKESQGPLHNLQLHAKELANLQAQIKTYLPAHIASHCSVTAWINGQLTIGVDDPVYMLELQYQRANLRDALRHNPVFAGLVSILFKVIPIIKTQTTFPEGSAQARVTSQVTLLAKSKQISAQSHQALQTAVEALDIDPNKAKLRAVLSRLMQYTD